MEHVYSYIRKLREENRYSQQEVASKLGVSHTAYRHIETGDTKLTIERLFELAKVFKVAPQDILYSGKTPSKSELNEAEISELKSYIIASGAVIGDAIGDLKLARIILREANLPDDEKERLFKVALEHQHTLEEHPKITEGLKKENAWKYEKGWLDYLNERIERFSNILNNIYTKGLEK